MQHLQLFTPLLLQRVGTWFSSLQGLGRLKSGQFRTFDFEATSAHTAPRLRSSSNGGSYRR